MTCNMRSTKDALIGDTFFHKDKTSEPLLEVTKPRPMVYAGFYPLDPSEQVREHAPSRRPFLKSNTPILAFKMHLFGILNATFLAF